ncbi:MAG: hypothetical protein E6Z13_09535, partial [Dermabacter sp.]|nr:hypothetical protein [Dermabacter sp.]
MSNTTGEVPLSDVHNTLDGLGEESVGTAPENPRREPSDPEHPHPGQWRLNHVQLSNWGTFHGTHDLEISS